MSSQLLLYIDKVQMDKMIRHAESVTEECCGFLLGTKNSTRTVVEVIPAKNVAPTNKTKRFEIDPLEYLKTENYADDKGLELIGIYHSHPDHPAIPSEHDRVAAQPYFSYVILSLSNARFESMKSWRLSPNHNFIEERIVNN